MEISGDEEGRLDAHLLGCDACSRRLQELVDLGGVIRSLVRHGAVYAIISDRLLERLARGGARVREYQVPVNGSVNCTVAPHDDLLVARLQAPLAGVDRLDLVLVDMGEPGEARLAEIPFDPASGTVILMPQITEVRRRPAHQARMRLVAVSGSGERVLGEYVFNHSPWRTPGNSG
jgi:hypothetical protein